MNASIRPLLLGASLICAGGAQAATLCVASVSSLIQAINSFDLQPDGSTVTIQVVQGTYAVGAQLVANIHESGDNEVSFKLLGGYTTNCAARTINPANTVIDAGNQANTGLKISLNGAADAVVEGITFTRFVAPSGGEVVALRQRLFSEDEGYSVRHCSFTANSARHVVRMRGARLAFSNNLVAANVLVGSGASAVHLAFDFEADSRIALNNNTVANNNGGAGVTIATEGRPSERLSEIDNNVLWNNSGSDLALVPANLAGAPAPLIFGNIIDDSTGATLPAGNLDVNPQFVNAGAGNYRLAAGSPGINSGNPAQLYGFPARDLDNGTRIIGSLVDRGAYEASVADQSEFLVTTAADNGNNNSPLAGSLRAAIKAANASTQPFRISFAIPGACPRIVSLAAPMLDVIGDVTIDGRTQPGWSANTRYEAFDANLCLVFNGSGSTPWALRVPPTASAARLVVHGLAMAGFTDAAIKLEGGANHRIAGNQFGAVPFTAANLRAIDVTGAAGATYIGAPDDTSSVNLIAGGSLGGVHLSHAAGGALLINNLIGFQADGLGNGGSPTAVLISGSPGNVLYSNRIGNSTNSGVFLSGVATTGTFLQYNVIGVDANGGPAGNANGSVVISSGARNSTIGASQGSSFGGNEIAHGTGPGVWVNNTGGAGNRVLANSMYGNGGLDIDLATAGASANQASNPASGPNQLQNYPVLSAATRFGGANPSILVSGQLHSAPNTSYRVDLYYAPSCSPAVPTRGSARRHLGAVAVATNAAGNGILSLSLPAPPLPRGFISATATSPTGDSSEIGNCVAEADGNAPPLVFANGFE